MRKKNNYLKMTLLKRELLNTITNRIHNSVDDYDFCVYIHLDIFVPSAHELMNWFFALISTLKRWQ